MSLNKDKLDDYLCSNIPSDQKLRNHLTDLALHKITSLSSIPLKGHLEPYLEFLERLGEEGFLRAYYELGLMYYNGDYIKTDYKKSYSYHKNAAVKGYADAQFEIYVYSSKGIGCEVNIEEAIKWLKKAAENGNVRAIGNIAGFYARGNEYFEKDINKSLEYYIEASGNGNGRASAILGVMYYLGEEIKKNKNKANKLFKKAEKQGFDVKAFTSQLGINLDEK